MKIIKGLFSRFSSLQAPEPIVKKTVQEAVKEVLHIQLDQKYIVFQNRVVFIQAGSAVKQACSMHKTQLLDMLKKTLPTIEIKDVR